MILEKELSKICLYIGNVGPKLNYSKKRWSDTKFSYFGKPVRFSFLICNSPAPHEYAFSDLKSQSIFTFFWFGLT